MSRDIFGSLLPNPGEDFVVGHSILQRQEFPRLAARNTSTTANNTINLFFDGASPLLQYAVSVVSACADTTVYAVQCTAAPASIQVEACGPDGPVSTQLLPNSQEKGACLRTVEEILETNAFAPDRNRYRGSVYLQIFGLVRHPHPRL